MNSNAELNLGNSAANSGYGTSKVFNLNTKSPYISKDKDEEYFGKHFGSCYLLAPFALLNYSSYYFWYE